MKVSYIIPVYKVEKYLCQCVKSIASQGYTDMEVILVDDGSPDKCPQLCDELAKVDSRIRVIHKKNGGLSDARNEGFLYATGDYVLYVDSDDFWVGQDSLQKLIEIARDNPECDFIGFNGSYYYPKSNAFVKWVEYSKELSRPVSGDKALQLLVKSGTFPMSACLKMIKRTFIEKNSIIFKKDQIAEDIPWFINLLDRCDFCMFVNNYIYGYRQNVSGSITSIGGEKSFFSLLDIVKTEVNMMSERSFSESGRVSLHSFLGYELSILIGNFRKVNKKRRAMVKRELKGLSYLLEYTENSKVLIVGKLYKMGGFDITRFVLGFYLWYRRRRK